jgi:hypothetical protein
MTAEDAIVMFFRKNLGSKSQILTELRNVYTPNASRSLYGRVNLLGVMVMLMIVYTVKFKSTFSITLFSTSTIHDSVYMRRS